MRLTIRQALAKYRELSRDGRRRHSVDWDTMRRLARLSRREARRALLLGIVSRVRAIPNIDNKTVLSVARILFRRLWRAKPVENPARNRDQGRGARLARWFDCDVLERRNRKTVEFTPDVVRERSAAAARMIVTWRASAKKTVLRIRPPSVHKVRTAKHTHTCECGKCVKGRERGARRDTQARIRAEYAALRERERRERDRHDPVVCTTYSTVVHTIKDRGRTVAYRHIAGTETPHRLSECPYAEPVAWAERPDGQAQVCFSVSRGVRVDATEWDSGSLSRADKVVPSMPDYVPSRPVSPATTVSRPLSPADRAYIRTLTDRSDDSELRDRAGFQNTYRTVRAIPANCSRIAFAPAQALAYVRALRARRAAAV